MSAQTEGLRRDFLGSDLVWHANLARESPSNHQASCGAAIRVKPKARLCEPWVVFSCIWRAAKRRQRIAAVWITLIAVAPSGLDHIDDSYPRLTKPRLGLNSDRCSAAYSSLRTSPFINRHVRHVARSDIFRPRANQFVVGVLFQDVCGPTADAANREDGCVEIQWDSHHVIG